MTVDELIRDLEKMPAEADVWLQCPEGWEPTGPNFPLSVVKLDETGDVYLEG